MERSADAVNYALSTLISDVHHGAEGDARAEISCVAALDKNIYIGCSNGKLMSYTLEDSIDGTTKYVLTSHKTLKSRSPILSLQIVPSQSKAIVLSEDTLSFLSLPKLDPIPSDIMRSMKNVLHFAINETPEPLEPVGLAIVKRTGIAFWEMGNKFKFLHEFPIQGVMHVRRSGPSLCIADLDTYIIVNLKNLSQIPIHPISLSPTWKILPKIEVFRPDQYIMVVCTDTSDDYQRVDTMGLVVNGNGDPTANPMEWKTMPEHICVDEEQIVSLHLDVPTSTINGESDQEHNSVIEVRNPGQSAVLQSLQLPANASGKVRLMTLARNGFAVPVNSRQEKLLLVPFSLWNRKESNVTQSEQPEEDSKFDEPIGSGLTPPPTPKKPTGPPSRGKEHDRTGSRNRNTGNDVSGSLTRFPTSRVLLASRSAIYALLPSTLLSQVEEMLDGGKVKDAAALLAQAQAKHAKDDDLAADFRYLNLRIGIAFLFQTAFEDAGDALFRGDLDPRWLMGLWEEWRVVVQNSSKSSSPVMVDIYSGLQPTFEGLKDTTIKQIVANYSPHLKPSTSESSAGQELQRTLEWSAREMLCKYLRKFRTRRQYVGELGGMYTDEAVNRAVDTVSVMLYAPTSGPEELQELRSLLDESLLISIDDVRDQLIENGHIQSLARMLEKRNDHSTLIELYVNVAEGTWRDPSISDPVAKVRALLSNSKDRALVQKHALWLLKRDRHNGLKLLIRNESRGARSSDEDTKLLAQIREIDEKAATEFLEYLVLQKKSLEPSLHTQLVTGYLGSLLKHMEDPKIAELHRSALSEYLSSASRSSRPFLFYFAFETPDSEHKQIRLKLAMVLQGSNFYDLEGLRRKLRVQEASLRSLLCLETAILDAKASDHKAALSVLVNDLQDFVSAEAYCSLGGRVITPKIAIAIADRLGLANWAALVLTSESSGGDAVNGNVGRSRRQASSHSPGVNGIRGGTPSDAASPAEPRKAMELTRMLLEVYMKAGESRAIEASRLLNAQAVNLDPADIIPQVPAGWSLDLVSSFLHRSFRRSLHEVYEGQILKQLSAGQNLQTSELAFEAFAAAGAMVEESNGDERDEFREANREEESSSPAADELKELSSRIEEKLAEKHRSDNMDTRPHDTRAWKRDQ
ncbi:hypothetical protein M408DRAFT_329694 [Serendipita vermifera MAFF 305830]|uniref:CNH domain-containing protein n=1 Tax=Serendipita vermifera MAFF 305830 TaxID=933852 RepID=A0A0C3ATZ9_SERVB|nr:hypothetical protein M408DRAFT_329694 [Serendipita vermifera MAFF 305830]